MPQTDCAYEYDGSYAGLLCCVFDCFARRERPVSVTETGRGQFSLFSVHSVETDMRHARRVRAGLCARSPEAERLFWRAYLTCLPEKELFILRAACRVFTEGSGFLRVPDDSDTFPLYGAVRHLGTELEKLRGFVRFSEFEGKYAAEIAPKNRVLPALRAHFCARFADQDFMIYDRTHHEALFSSRGRWRIVPLDSFTMARPGETEAQYRRLWKTFFDAVAIRERTNPRCQRTNLPLRYRGTMTEFQDEAYFLPREEALPGGAETASLPRPD